MAQRVPRVAVANANPPPRSARPAAVAAPRRSLCRHDVELPANRGQMTGKEREEKRREEYDLNAAERVLCFFFFTFVLWRRSWVSFSIVCTYDRATWTWISGERACPGHNMSSPTTTWKGGKGTIWQFDVMIKYSEPGGTYCGSGGGGKGKGFEIRWHRQNSRCRLCPCPCLYLFFGMCLSCGHILYRYSTDTNQTRRD